MDEPLVILDNCRLTALDPMTGAVRWSTDLPGVGRIYARLMITEGVVVVVDLNWLYCCDQKTGQPLWRVPTPGMAPVGVVVRGGRIFVYCKGSVDCYDGRGQRLWHRDGENHYDAQFGFADNICWVMDRTSS